LIKNKTENPYSRVKANLKKGKKKFGHAGMIKKMLNFFAAWPMGPWGIFLLSGDFSYSAHIAQIFGCL
jgi:hypothetical protein